MCLWFGKVFPKEMAHGGAMISVQISYGWYFAWTGNIAGILV